jgi:mycothiol synthase
MATELVLRSAKGEDIPALGRLARARELAFEGAAETTDEEIAHDLAAPGVDLVRDTRVVEDTAGNVIGYADLLAGGEHTLDVTMWTEPDGATRTRQVEDRLLGALEGRAAEMAQERGWTDMVLHAFVPDADTGRAELLLDRGYRRGRTFHRMVLRPAAPTPSVPRLDGIVLEPLDPTADAAAVHALLLRAFAEHELMGIPADLPTWRHDTVDDPRWVPGPSLVARSNGMIVGAVVGFPEDEQGWIRHLGVASSHRGRGLGAALLAASIARFRDMGLAQVGLGVDSTNRSGATRLYERVGMRVARRVDLFELGVRASA